MLNPFTLLFTKMQGKRFFNHIYIGKHGERIAVRYLKFRRYKILETNFESRYGEIDIIAKDKDIIVFVEVKTRTNDDFGQPEAAVNKSKQDKIKLAAKFYINKKRLSNFNSRFDIISIKIQKGKKKEIFHIKDAFRIK
jgi:putative endonuclease